MQRRRRRRRRRVGDHRRFGRGGRVRCGGRRRWRDGCRRAERRGDLQRADRHRRGRGARPGRHRRQAYDTATPQCSYAYDTESGGTSNATIASLRGDGDLGGRTGQDAFGYAVEVNRAVAGGTDFDEAEVEAGDRAVRFSGETMHLGIVSAGSKVFTVAVPVDDATPDAVDALIVQVADQLG